LIVGISATASALGAVGPVEGHARAEDALAASGASLDERIDRLTQMREWLRDDALRAMVDGAIGQQVKASERRQRVYVVAAVALSLLAGWLLSAMRPVSTVANVLPP